MHFLCKTNYRIDHTIKRFHEENSITSGLFSENNLLLCGMQSKNRLSAKMLKNVRNHLYSQSVCTFDKRQICSASYWLFEQRNKEFIILIVHLMVLLCVICKSV